MSNNTAGRLLMRAALAGLAVLVVLPLLAVISWSSAAKVSSSARGPAPALIGWPSNISLQLGKPLRRGGVLITKDGRGRRFVVEVATGNTTGPAWRRIQSGTTTTGQGVWGAVYEIPADRVGRFKYRLRVLAQGNLPAKKTGTLSVTVYKPTASPREHRRFGNGFTYLSGPLSSRTLVLEPGTGEPPTAYPLTHAPRRLINPTLTPDRKYVLFYSHRDPNTNQTTVFPGLYSYSLETEMTVKLESGGSEYNTPYFPGGHEPAPVLPAEGTKVLLVNAEQTTLRTSNFDGTDSKTLLTNCTFVNVPEFSPNGAVAAADQRGCDEVSDDFTAVILIVETGELTEAGPGPNGAAPKETPSFDGFLDDTHLLGYGRSDEYFWVFDLETKRWNRGAVRPVNRAYEFSANNRYLGYVFHRTAGSGINAIVKVIDVRTGAARLDKIFAVRPGFCCGYRSSVDVSDTGTQVLVTHEADYNKVERLRSIVSADGARPLRTTTLDWWDFAATGQILVAHEDRVQLLSSAGL